MNPVSKIHPSHVAIVQQSHQPSTNCLYRLFCCCRRIKTAPTAPETQVSSNTKNPLALKEIELIERAPHAPFSPHSALRRSQALGHVAISIKDPVPSAIGGAAPFASHHPTLEVEEAEAFYEGSKDPRIMMHDLVCTTSTTAEVLMFRHLEFESGPNATAPFVREESRVPSPLLLDVETDAALPGLKHLSHLKVEKVPTACDFALMFVLNPIKKQLPDGDVDLKIQIIHEIFKISNFSNLLALKEILQTKENEHLMTLLDPELQAKLRSLSERPTTFEILRLLKK
jgi:hypothetical protein